MFEFVDAIKLIFILKNHTRFFFKIVLIVNLLKYYFLGFKYKKIDLLNMLKFVMGFYEKNATFFVPKSMLFNTNMKNGEK